MWNGIDLLEPAPFLGRSDYVIDREDPDFPNCAVVRANTGHVHAVFSGAIVDATIEYAICFANQAFSVGYRCGHHSGAAAAYTKVGQLLQSGMGNL